MARGEPAEYRLAVRVEAGGIALEPRGDELRIEHTVTLAPDAERLRVVVRDVRTGAIGAIGVSRRQLEAIVS